MKGTEQGRCFLEYPRVVIVRQICPYVSFHTFSKVFIDLVKVLYEHSIANSRVLRCVTHDGTVTMSLFGIFCYVTKHLVLTIVWQPYGKLGNWVDRLLPSLSPLKWSSLLGWYSCLSSNFDLPVHQSSHPPPLHLVSHASESGLLLQTTLWYRFTFIASPINLIYSYVHIFATHI